PAPPPPAAVQADVGLLPRAPGAMPVSARLYAEPGLRYRLDVFGFPALIAASWVWADGGWLLVRHDRREARRGAGDALEAPDLRVRVPDVHAALGFLWGAPLPGWPGDDSARAGAVRNGGTVRWTHAGEPWEARIDPATGLCLEARSP